MPPVYRCADRLRDSSICTDLFLSDNKPVEAEAAAEKCKHSKDNTDYSACAESAVGIHADNGISGEVVGLEADASVIVYYSLAFLYTSVGCDVNHYDTIVIDLLLKCRESHEDSTVGLDSRALKKEREVIAGKRLYTAIELELDLAESLLGDILLPAMTSRSFLRARLSSPTVLSS